MLKLKPLIIGTVAQVLIFLLFMSVIAFSSKAIGNVSGDGYSLAMEIAAALAVMTGAFISARCAFEKGAIYGIIIAAIWILLRVLFTIIVTGGILVAALIFNGLIMCGFGFIGGALGISKRKRKFI